MFLPQLKITTMHPYIGMCRAYNEDLINSALAKNSCEGVQDCHDSDLRGDRRSDWSEFMTGILPTGERDHPTSSSGAF